VGIYTLKHFACKQIFLVKDACILISIWCILESHSIGKKIANYTYAQTTRYLGKQNSAGY